MATRKKSQAKPAEAPETFEELTQQSVTSMTETIHASAETQDLVVSKITSLACHITAIEALLGEIIKITGIDLTQVNSLIRARISSVDGDPGDANAVVDIASSIASSAIKKP